MKPLFTILFSLLFSVQLVAQGVITGFSVSPINPTTDDNIELMVEVQFNSGDCQVDNQGHNISGLSISGFSHHCVGALTFICPTTATFNLGQLAAGTYTFNHTLTSGFGAPSCSPGIVADDTDQFQFTVSPTVGINEIDFDSNLIYPNPVTDILFFKRPLKAMATLTNIEGKTVMQIEKGKKEIVLTALPAGTYFLQSELNQVKLVKD